MQTIAAVETPNPAHPEQKQRHQIDSLQLIVFPARAFLALGWTRAGVEKLIDRTWWDGTVMHQFLDTHIETRLPFLDGIAHLIGFRIAIMLAAVVLLAEFGIAASFATAKRLPYALATACALNVAFVALGAVTPSAFYLVLQLTLFLALYLRRPVRSATSERVVAAVGVAAALALAPFVRSLHPHAVIDDPAIMLATLALLAAATLAIIASTPIRLGEATNLPNRLLNATDKP